MAIDSEAGKQHEYTCRQYHSELPQALFGLAFFSSCTNLILVYIQHIRVPVRQSYVLEVVALAVGTVLTYLAHTRTRKSSSILLLFWPAYTVGFVIWTRTQFTTMNSEILPVLGFKCAVVALGILSLRLECLGPEQVDPLKHENPVLTANIFSIWTFGWMTPLMKKGASDYITEEDLPDLLPEDAATKLSDDLKKALDKQYVLYFFPFRTILIGIKWTRWKSSSLERVIRCLWAAISSGSVFEDCARLSGIPSAPASPLVTCLYLGLSKRARWYEIWWSPWRKSFARLCNSCNHVHCRNDAILHIASSLSSQSQIHPISDLSL